MICSHCKKSQLVTYSDKDILNNVAYKKSIQRIKNDIEKSNYYKLEFSTVSGDSGKFTGTKEEIYKQINSYEWTGFKNIKKEDKLRMIAVCISFLKYGYMDEFKNSDYENYEITIDNGLWMKISYGI